MENSFPRPRVWKPFVFSSFVLLTFTDKWRGVEGKYPLSSLYIHELVTIKKKKKRKLFTPDGGLAASFGPARAHLPDQSPPA